MTTYETSVKVRFGDIDHAGIVYYPRYFHYLHTAFEDFFGARMGVPYATILDERKVGFPTVRAEADFARGLAYGDVVNVSVDVLRVGRSSVTMRYRLRRNGEDEVAMEARITTACVDLSTFAPMPIPDDLRRLFSDHLVG